MENGRKKTIVLFRARMAVTNRRTCEGVFGYGRCWSWQIQSIKVPSLMDATSPTIARRERKRLADILSFWNPAGCIVMGDAIDPYRNYRNFDGVPVVHCDALPESLPVGSNLVCIDSQAVSLCAAKELLSLGFDSYAYVSYPNQYPWCESRKKCFSSIIETNGKHFSSIRLPKRDAPAADHRAFARWLSALPKPVGLFAANDSVAETVIDVCIRSGLSIPQDVALVGADNDALLCENAAVSISSVIPDFYAAGENAARLLNELMEAPKTAQFRTFGVVGVVRRASTRRTEVFDQRIMKALEYIRRHASMGIGVSDVIAEMGCSRRYADLRFRRIVGCSILQEIRKTKIDRVKEMLRGSESSLAAIADMCGFASCDDMRRTFRQFSGESLVRWRRNVKSTTPQNDLSQKTKDL